MSVIYDRVALIGLGLIASSMFWAMKRAGLAGEVTGYARSQETRDVAREIGLCDRVCDSAAEAVEGAPFRQLNDGVSPVVIGGADWAGAWAVDERGDFLVPVGRVWHPAGAPHRGHGIRLLCFVAALVIRMHG